MFGEEGYSAWFVKHDKAPIYNEQEEDKIIDVLPGTPTKKKARGYGRVLFSFGIEKTPLLCQNWERE